MGGGKGGDDSAKKAAQAQIQGLQMQIAQADKAAAQAETAYQPYTEAGLTALDQYRALIGLGGQDQQQAAIGQLAQSPFYQAQLRQAENSLLQNASATGGLRTGNTQTALSAIAPELLNQQYLQQVGLLGGMQEQGLNVTTNLANLRAGNAAAAGQAMAQQGAALGQSILAQQAARQQSSSGMLGGAISGAVAGQSIFPGPIGAIGGGIIGALGGK